MCNFILTGLYVKSYWQLLNVLIYSSNYWSLAQLTVDPEEDFLFNLVKLVHPFQGLFKIIKPVKYILQSINFIKGFITDCNLKTRYTGMAAWPGLAIIFIFTVVMRAWWRHRRHVLTLQRTPPPPQIALCVWVTVAKSCYINGTHFHSFLQSHHAAEHAGDMIRL